MDPEGSFVVRFGRHVEDFDKDRLATGAARCTATRSSISGGLSFWAAWHPGLRSVDIVDRWLAHEATTGRSTTGFDDRLRACHLAIGIDHLGYNAFMNRWDDLATHAQHLERFLPG